jgi:pimeloyl-ACP methyl ester carboxylesterase
MPAKSNLNHLVFCSPVRALIVPQNIISCVSWGKEEIMETIQSKDGTRIAYQRSGSGSPLVLVHGTTADHTRWAPVLPAFEAKFSVYVVDRRGRGDSGDAQPYSIEREFDDVATLVDSIPGLVNLLGHSYGAICSLEAALLTKNLRKVILYEPPIPTNVGSAYPPDVVERLGKLLSAGDPAGAVTLFFQQIVHAPPHEMELLKSSPSWPARVAAAHTIFRELQASNAYMFDAEKIRRLSLPVLLLQGGDSPAFFKSAIERLHATLPDSRVVILPGQQHMAISTAPDLFARETLAFLDGRA